MFVGFVTNIRYGIWVIHTEVANLGVTLFDSYSYDGVSAGIWVIHTGPKSGGQTLACILSKMCYYIPSFMIGYCDYDV